MAPIGIFDSGLGGLSIAHQCRRLFPTRSFLYFGDTARAPYGNKSASDIYAMMRQNLQDLKNLGVNAVLIACSTACAVGLPELSNEFPLLLLDIIQPGARAALAQSKRRKIGVLATRATVDSGAYLRAFARLDSEAQIHQVACPYLATQIEEGLLDHPTTNRLLRDYLSHPELDDVDTILLGCTHFAFVKEQISQIRPKVQVVDPAKSCAQELEKHLAVECGGSLHHNAQWTWHFSGESQALSNRAQSYLDLLG